MSNYIHLQGTNHEYIGRFDIPNSVIDGDVSFQIIRHRHGGGNGQIFEANCCDGSGNVLHKCAVKFLRQLDESKVDRFNNELRILKEVDHPRISKYFGTGVVNLGEHSVPWLAIELGEENLRRHVQSHGCLSTKLLKKLAIESCEATLHLHSLGFIHRDIKPANFVFIQNSTEETMMIDFGIAKRIDEDVSGRPLDDFTKTLEFVGPVFFSSPELIAYADDKSVEVGYPSDAFQLGKLFWFLGTSKIAAGIPSKRQCPFQGGLWELVCEMIQDAPEERLSNLEEVCQRLRAL